MASRTSSVVTPDSTALQGFAGSQFDPSFRTKGEDSPVQRHRKKKPSNKPLKQRSFEENIAYRLLGLTETVRKKGNQWVLFDDETGVETGAYKSRKAAWAQQRVRRQQKKFRKKNRATAKPKPVKHAKSKKNKPVKAQVPQVKKTPKVKNVKGVKKIKPISALKPIRPKGLRSQSKQNENFVNKVVLSILNK